MNQSSIDLIRIPIKDIFTEIDPDLDVIKVLGLAKKYLENKESLNSVPEKRKIHVTKDTESDNHILEK